MGEAMVKKVEIARALGVSPAAVSKYIKRGMPTTSSAAAKAWCAANLDPVRRVAQQWGLNAKRSGGGSASTLVAHANELGRLATGDFERYEAALRVALNAARGLPESIRDLVLIDEAVWDRLIGVPCTSEGWGEIPLGHGAGVDPAIVEWLWTIASGAEA